MTAYCRSAQAAHHDIFIQYDIDDFIDDREFDELMLDMISRGPMRQLLLDF